MSVENQFEGAHAGEDEKAPQNHLERPPLPPGSEYDNE